MANSQNPQDQNQQLLQELVQRITTLHARIQATQCVLVAAVSALAQASSAGAKKIEQYALQLSEGTSMNLPAEQAEVIRLEVDKMLSTARAAATGKIEPRGRR